MGKRKGGNPEGRKLGRRGEKGGKKLSKRPGGFRSKHLSKVTTIKSLEELKQEKKGKKHNGNYPQLAAGEHAVRWATLVVHEVV